jgi:hypothetical protein
MYNTISVILYYNIFKRHVSAHLEAIIRFNLPSVDTVAMGWGPDVEISLSGYLRICILSIYRRDTCFIVVEM